jgi:hypothetical protein
VKKKSPNLKTVPARFAACRAQKGLAMVTTAQLLARAERKHKQGLKKKS